MTREELEQLVKELKRRIEELEQWRRDRARQQLTNPIDLPSRNLIKKAAQ